MGNVALICDSDFDTRFLSERTIRSRGYRVVLAADGIEAADAIRHHRPEVILLDADLRWGGADGVLDMVRRFEGCDYAPLVLLVGNDTTISLAERCGVPESQCLRKPLTARGLQNVLSGARTTPLMDALQI
jgi:CheY-like chemotaxis protein